MDRVTALARMHHGPGEGAERMEAVYLGFEAVGDHLIETVGIGVEHHDGHRNARSRNSTPSSANATAR